VSGAKHTAGVRYCSCTDPFVVSFSDQLGRLGWSHSDANPPNGKTNLLGENGMIIRSGSATRSALSPEKRLTSRITLEYITTTTS
jgi:hypothetical protein